MIQSKDDEGITDEMTANANLIAGAPKLLEMLQLALSDPKKLDDTATAYWLSTKYPVTKAVQEKADYYTQFVNAIKVATNGI